MEIIERIEDGLTFFQIELFNNRNVSHLFTSRLGWENNKIEKLSKLFNVPKDNIIGLTQVHGTDILVVDEDIKNSEKTTNIKADGMVTNVPNMVLITYHADCVPIYFYDYSKKVIGLAHGGWKGTYGNISGKMLDLMIDRYNSNIDNVLVGIGPSIGPCCYEVGKDLAFQFMNKYNKFDGIVEKRHNKLYLDLWKINYLQVKDKGVRRENIAVTKACTSCHNDKFYSYRKEKSTNNRMIAAIKINS